MSETRCCSAQVGRIPAIPRPTRPWVEQNGSLVWWSVFSRSLECFWNGQQHLSQKVSLSRPSFEVELSEYEEYGALPERFPFWAADDYVVSSRRLCGYRYLHFLIIVYLFVCKVKNECEREMAVDWPHLLLVFWWLFRGLVVAAHNNMQWSDSGAAVPPQTPVSFKPSCPNVTSPGLTSLRPRLMHQYITVGWQWVIMSVKSDRVPRTQSPVRLAFECLG